MPAFLRAGIACTPLLADPKAWINRRVETIEMLTHEETRRRVSVDFTLSAGLQEELEVDDGVVVPLVVLTKEARRNFDLRDESGRSIPVLGKGQNGQLAHVALMNAAFHALPDDLTPEVFELLAADLRRVVFEDPSEAVDQLATFYAADDRWRTAITEDADCKALLDVLWQNYVLFAVLPPGGPTRRILKYSYGDDFDATPRQYGALARVRGAARRILDPDSRDFVIWTPGASRAASFHVEVAIPEELRIRSAFLYDVVTEEAVSDVDRNVNRASLYVPTQVDAESVVDTYVEVSPERTGMVSQAAATSFITAVLLWVGVASGLDAKNPGAAISLLLAGAALFSGFTALQGKHRLVKTVFSGTRRWLGLVTVASLTASAGLAMEMPKEHPVCLWRVCAIACTAAAARLLWGAIRSPS